MTKMVEKYLVQLLYIYIYIYLFKKIYFVYYFALDDIFAMYVRLHYKSFKGDD